MSSIPYGDDDEDPQKIDLTDKIREVKTTTVDYDIIVAPLLSFAKYWHQESPFNDLYPEVRKYIPNMTSYYNGFSQYSGIITFDNYFQITTYIPLIIMIISCCFLTISIYYSFSSKIVGISASLLYAIGIILTTAIGLSPTLYASSHRTHTLLYIIIIMIISLMYYYNEYMFTVKQKKSIKYILLFIAYFSLFIQTILIIELFEKFH